MKILQNLLWLLVLTGIACSDGDNGAALEINAPSALYVRDISNFGNARDMEIGFDLPGDISKIDVFRVFMVKGDNAAQFDSLAAVEASQFEDINAEDDLSIVILDEDFKDVDGDVVVEGMAYKAFVASIGKEETGLKLSKPSSEVTLQQKSAVRTLTGIIEAGSGGMDLDENGNIYMGDFGPTLSAGGANVYKITPDGEVSVFNSTLNGASGNDFDMDGNLYQSSTAGFMTKIAPDGTSTVVANGFTGGLIGVSVQDDGSFFVCNCGGNLIYQVTADGDISTYVASELFNCPNGIDVDDEGNLYIANFGNGDVLKVASDLEVTVLATVPGGNNGHLLIHDELIYVVARRGNAIYKLDFEGKTTKFAGSGNRGTTNGSISEATFSLPNDIAISTDGRKMYVNDVAGSNTNESVISPVVIREIDIVED